jgi:hypothetical protein
MVKALSLAFTATAVLLGHAGTAMAADFCLSTGASTLTLKAFSLPGKGACKEVRGFFSGLEAIWVAGMACGSSDNDHVTFIVSGMAATSAFLVTGRAVLDRETLSGPVVVCQTDSGVCAPSVTYDKVNCAPKTVPVP